jgi:hypothetical protein
LAGSFEISPKENLGELQNLAQTRLEKVAKTWEIASYKWLIVN